MKWPSSIQLSSSLLSRTPCTFAGASCVRVRAAVKAAARMRSASAMAARTSASAWPSPFSSRAASSSSNGPTVCTPIQDSTPVRSPSPATRGPRSASAAVVSPLAVPCWVGTRWTAVSVPVSLARWVITVGWATMRIACPWRVSSLVTESTR
ncbi:hypothetical protein ACFFX0_07050 [Citricoccus parietis]|uniref:Uncharacterized protein n=1 Tax=Citricoccus parietis TaxID=592307 RepID=A0ABV5FWA6_9MICC